MNRTQLENAITGVYGEKTDASQYLGKFVRLFVTLPNRALGDDVYSTSHVKNFIKATIGKYDVGSAEKDVENFSQELWLWTLLCKLSLRELEQIIAMYMLADCPRATGAAAYLLVLKVRHPAV